jgi:Tfp pilus assembly protein PilP
MKLIQIFALATAMATMATAQNSSPSNGQNAGGPKASPTATPSATKSGAKPQNAAKKSPTVKAKAPSTTGSATKPAGQSGTAATSGGKVAVKTGTIAAPKTKSGTAPQKKPVQVMATPTPVASPRVTTAAKSGAAAKGHGPAKTDAKSSAKTPAIIAVKPAQTTAAKKTGASTARAPAKAPATAAGATAVASKPEEKPKPVTRAYGAHGRRDPFVSPIRDRGTGGPMPNCTTGKRCLAIPELVLQGTVKDTSGKMMAVVANSSKRTYFLRENDQVFNGSVEKITSDSIIFREYVKDALGRETAREVVKKLVPAS